MRRVFKIAAYIVAAVAAIVLQNVFAGPLSLLGSKANFALIIAISVGVCEGYRAGAFFGAAAGFAIDSAGGIYVGLTALLLMFAGLFAGILTRKMLWSLIPSAIAALFAVYAARIALYAVFYLFLGGGAGTAVLMLLKELLATAVYALPLSFAACKMFLATSER